MTAFVNRQSVTAIIIKNGMVLMNLRDNKNCIWNPNMWSMIGGHVESQETLAEALFREVEEETGNSLCMAKVHPLINFHYAGINTMTTIFKYDAGDEFETFLCTEGVETRWVDTKSLLLGRIWSETTQEYHDVAPEHLDVWERLSRCLPS